MLVAFKVLKFLFRYGVPVPLRYVAARMLASLVYHASASRRRVLIRNLTPLIGAKEAARVAPRLFGNFAMTSVDFFCPRRDLVRNIEGEYDAVLHKYWKRYKKVIIVTSHLGNWELGMSYLISKHFSMAGVYAPYREDDVVSWIMSHRNPDVEWIPVAHGAAEACLNALERGRVLGLLADIPYGEKGRRVQIGSGHTHLPLGPWAIAVRAHAVVVPGFVLRTRPGRYRIVFHDPIEPSEGSFRKQMERMQEVYRAHLENYLTRYPDQWGMLQSFWDKT